MYEAAGRRHHERAASLRRRARRLETILGRLGGLLEATHARPRLVVAAHPTAHGTADAFWLAGGRLVDWGAAPARPGELHVRTAAAVRAGGRAGELGAHVPPEEVDEIRIIAAYLASHPRTPVLVLDPPPAAEELAAFAASAERQLDDERGVPLLADGDA
jgi:DNA polymerase-3 subunit epsilon